jgi:hypothetical protein
VNEVKLLQFSKELSPIDVMEDGDENVNDDKLIQFKKQFVYMAVTLDGIVTEVKLMQPAKESLPIDVTEDGSENVNEVIVVKSKKAPSLMSTTVYENAPSEAVAGIVTLAPSVGSGLIKDAVRGGDALNIA